MNLTKKCKSIVIFLIALTLWWLKLLDSWLLGSIQCRGLNWGWILPILLFQPLGTHVLHVSPPEVQRFVTVKCASEALLDLLCGLIVVVLELTLNVVSLGRLAIPDTVVLEISCRFKVTVDIRLQLLFRGRMRGSATEKFSLALIEVERLRGFL